MHVISIAWNSGGGYIRLTYTGSGNGTISVESDVNNGAARSQVITVQTLDDVVTRNLTVSQAACPIPEGTVLNYSYTGTVQEVTLPSGKYKLQVWGAQGGSNAAASSYGITAQAGGKGGYSEGIITLTQATILKVYVGGQGSASAGGFNGGGSTAGTSTANAGGELGYSKMGGGGGATDIRLSSGSLYSRMIVAGGGGGGAMAYKAVISTETVTKGTLTNIATNTVLYANVSTGQFVNGGAIGASSSWNGYYEDISTYRGCLMTVTPNTITERVQALFTKTIPTLNTAIDYAGDHSYSGWAINNMAGSGFTATVPSDASYVYFATMCGGNDRTPVSATFTKEEQVTTTSTNSQVGYVGGGVNGGGFIDFYKGKQDGAGGNGGSFGEGAAITGSQTRYCSGAGGGGWYGGGRDRSNTDFNVVKYSGGGSGFVNTAANAQYRPSGYTGIELDSGETRDGATSFPNTAGTGNETGHAGNGYAKITRLHNEGYEAKIEYLRSTGTQYIDTGIKGASDIKIVIDGKYNSTSSNQGHGSYVSPIFYLGVYSSKFIFRSGSSSATSPVSANTNRHVFSMENGVGKVDNTSYTIGTYSGNEGDYLYLFARKTSSGVGLQASFWLYSCQIYKNNVLVRDFIPVRIGQTGYLYDKVSGELFGNTGSGSFTLGPDVQQ